MLSPAQDIRTLLAPKLPNRPRMRCFTALTGTLTLISKCSEDVLQQLSAVVAPEVFFFLIRREETDWQYKPHELIHEH